MKKPDINKLYRNIKIQLEREQFPIVALVIVAIMLSTGLLVYQAHVVYSFKNYPKVPFNMSDFVEMNLARSDEMEKGTDLSKEEDLARSIVEELENGFRDTARRVFLGKYGQYRLKQFLPRDKRNLQGGIDPETMDLAIDNALDRFRTNSIQTLERRLRKLDEKYVEDYAHKLPEYLLEAYDRGVRVFSVIKPRTIEEVNVISSISRSASYRHFNRLYYRQIRSLEKQKSKEGENYRATEKLTLYIAAFMTLTIIMLAAILILLYRKQYRV